MFSSIHAHNLSVITVETCMQLPTNQQLHLHGNGAAGGVTEVELQAGPIYPSGLL